MQVQHFFFCVTKSGATTGINIYKFKIGICNAYAISGLFYHRAVKEVALMQAPFCFFTFCNILAGSYRPQSNAIGIMQDPPFLFNLFNLAICNNNPMFQGLYFLACQ